MKTFIDFYDTFIYETLLFCIKNLLFEALYVKSHHHSPITSCYDYTLVNVISVH